MRSSVLSIALLAYLNPALAAQEKTIDLETVSFAPMPGQAPGAPEAYLTMTARCGSAVITFNGAIKGEDGTLFLGTGQMDQAAPLLEVSAGKGAVRFPDPKGQVDHNVGSGLLEMACVATPKGKYLLVQSGCSGRSCVHDHYLVIDTATAKVLTPSIDVDGTTGCDQECAESALGQAMPKWIQYRQ